MQQFIGLWLCSFDPDITVRYARAADWLVIVWKLPRCESSLRGSAAGVVAFALVPWLGAFTEPRADTLAAVCSSGRRCSHEFGGFLQPHRGCLPVNLPKSHSKRGSNVFSADIWVFDGQLGDGCIGPNGARTKNSARLCHVATAADSLSLPPRASTKSASNLFSSPVMSMKSPSKRSSSFLLVPALSSLSTSSGVIFFRLMVSVRTNDTRSFQVSARRVDCLPDSMWRRTSSGSRVWRTKRTVALLSPLARNSVS